MPFNWSKKQQGNRACKWALCGRRHKITLSIVLKGVFFFFQNTWPFANALYPPHNPSEIWSGHSANPSSLSERKQRGGSAVRRLCHWASALGELGLPDKPRSAEKPHCGAEVGGCSPQVSARRQAVSTGLCESSGNFWGLSIQFLPYPPAPKIVDKCQGTS